MAESIYEEENEEVLKEIQENRSSQPTLSKTWYPYITKAQFEKFLARLENKIPEQVDRDYIRAIIRTPSMIYRFLRGIEAMKLIDREQRPTSRLRRLVAPESRRQAIAEVLKDLYADLLQQWQDSAETLNDDDIVDFFRAKTGMGRDSANKMKMFFKYLLGEADFGESPLAPPSQLPQPQAQASVQPRPQTPPAEERRSSRDTRPEVRIETRPASTPAQPPQLQQQVAAPLGDRGQRTLNEAQKAFLQTLQTMVRINIDGDWDDEMIRSVFDRLERLFDRIRRG